MIRSLWTGATGMLAQQTNLDVIANNLSNVNSVGYKSQAAEFKSLLYQTIQDDTTLSDGTPKPTNAQVGLGTRNSAINSSFTQGNITQTESDTDFAIVGDGFFGIRGADGNTYYTRNGSFQWSLGPNNTLQLTTAEGNQVLNSKGAAISLNRNTYQTSKISISAEGEICYPDATGNPASLGISIGVYQFNNPQGLANEGDTTYLATDASGPAINEATNNKVEKSIIRQGFLESSNVQVADEMVNMIVAQRAYEFASKVITTSDTMMEQANNLKR